MKLSSTVIWFIWTWVSVTRGKKHEAIRAETYSINLDDPPSERWIPVLKHFNKSTITAGILAYEKRVVPSAALRNALAVIAGDLNKYIPQPYADEMLGIAEYYDIPLGQIVLANLGNELVEWNSTGFKQCTSIVAMDKDGYVIHGKNTDYEPTDPLADVTADVKFYRNSKLEFIATVFVGGVGIMNAAKPAAFSLTYDNRRYGRLWENILSALENHWPITMMSREIMANAHDYESAMRIVTRAELIAPIYFIVGGLKPQEGAIVVGDRWGAIDVIKMENFRDGWFVVQTNFDPWTTPPSSDNRRDPAIKYMKSYGQKQMTFDTMYKVLSKRPVLNYQTISTTTMAAFDITSYKTMLRFDRPNKKSSTSHRMLN